MRHWLPTCILAAILVAAPPAAATGAAAGDVGLCSGTLFFFPTLPATIVVPDAAGGVVVLGDNPYVSCPDLRVASDHSTIPWPAAGQPAPLFEKWAVADGAGGLFAVWRVTSGGTPLLRASHWDATGAIVSGWPADAPVADTFAVTSRVALCTDGGGGVFCAWVDAGTTGHLLYAQHVFGNGAVASDTPKAVCSIPATRTLGTIVADGAGGAFVVWEDDRGGGSSTVLAQRIDSGLALQWDASGVTAGPTPNTQQKPVAAPDGAGGLYIAWQDDRAGNDDILLQRLTSGGVAAGGWPVAGTVVTTRVEAQVNPAALADGAGGVYLAWSEGEAATCEVFATRIDASGGVVSGWSAGGVPATPHAGGGTIVTPSIVSDHEGGLRIVWVQTDPGTADRFLRVQTLTSSGTRAAGWPADGVAVTSIDVVSLYGPAIEAVSDASDGTLFVVWSTTFGGVTSRSYGRALTHVGADGLVPALASLASAEATSASVRLRWFTSGLDVTPALERDDGDGAWKALGPLADEGGGYRSYEDRDVRPGGRYGYRLAWSENGAINRSEPAYVDIPAIEALRLEGAKPNPAAGPLRVAFALAPGGAPARLDVFDLAGRLRWSRRVDGLGAGRHEIDVAASLAPGVYRLRLTQAAASRERAVAVVR